MASKHTVDLHLAVLHHRADEALLLEVLDAPPRERAVDLHAVDEGGDGDEAEGLDILVELLRSLLVEDDGVLGLVLDLALGPGGSVLEEEDFSWGFRLALHQVGVADAAVTYHCKHVSDNGTSK